MEMELELLQNELTYRSDVESSATMPAAQGTIEPRPWRSRCVVHLSTSSPIIEKCRDKCRNGHAIFSSNLVVGRYYRL